MSERERSTKAHARDCAQSREEVRIKVDHESEGEEWAGPGALSGRSERKVGGLERLDPCTNKQL